MPGRGSETGNNQYSKSNHELKWYVMKKYDLILLVSIVISFSFRSVQDPEFADPASYLNDVKVELNKKWSKNRTINLVFHGHSVPAGYYKTPLVKPFGAYPLMLLKELKELYPYAVINIINTSIGGENAVSGANRFDSDVLVHKPDVLFIDYSLNDRGVGLEESKEAWTSMIGKALNDSIKIILLTPSPDTRMDILEPNNILEQHANQVRNLASHYEIGLIDSYELFRNKVLAGDSLSVYMSSVVHPNEKGHQIITDELLRYFK
jgi:lysophospholipase L1-like esterase